MGYYGKNKNKSNGNKYGKSRDNRAQSGKSKKLRGKEFELNVPRGDVNAADLKDSKGSENDPSWYSKYEQLMKDVASFPYGVPSGSKIRWTDGATSEFATPLSYDQVPGIMVLDFAPTIGVADSPNAPINIVSKALFAFDRKANSGRVNYNNPDLMIYVLSMDSAYFWYAFMCRIYGLMTNFSFLNRYTPVALVQAIGVDYEDISTKLADFRAFINLYAYKIGSLAVPSGMDYVTRHTWMSMNVFTDANSTKAQYFLYNPVEYYVFDEMTGGPGQLTIHKVNEVLEAGQSLLTMDNIMDIANQIVDPILASEDMSIMSGDILKAFEANNIYSLSPIADNFVIQPVFSPEVLSQIENANIVRGVTISNITQNTEVGDQYLIQTVKLAKSFPIQASFDGIAGIELDSANSVLSARRLMNMHKPDPTPSDNMVASRLMLGSLTEDETNVYTVHSCGSEIIVDCYIYIDPSDTVNRRYVLTTGMNMRLQNTDGYNNLQITQFANAIAKYASYISAFDWHPTVYFGATGNSITQEPQFQGPICDVDNYTMISSDSIDWMHEVALMSMFAVPQISLLFN